VSELLDSVSAVIAVVQFVFAVVLIPTLLSKKAYIHRFSSGLTAVGLFVIAVCFFLIRLDLAAIAEGITTIMWVALFVWRGKRVMSKIVIAMDCDGTVDISAGPVPLEAVRKLAEKYIMFCIGAQTLVNFVSIPWDQAGGKSAALVRWKQYVSADRYIVVDDNPAQYQGWDGWEFYSPQEFKDKILPTLL
jgi:hypothetical protein